MSDEFEREKGSATLACPQCGNELAAEKQPDGSLAAGTCDKHGQTPEPEKASEVTISRREVGTPLEGDSDTWTQ